MLITESLLPGLHKDQLVRVRRFGHNEEWCPGTVCLVSGNGKSVLLSLDAAVRTNDGGLIAAALPLSLDHDAGTITGLDGTEYEVEVRKWPE